ncbi:hypothetical protein BO70DRAFT_431591 [Aspergillus heteromorphus CBS 117.55]|uniref:Uncharacterized protein n=1 Tax=Aspergillus heteromorphus CBS 117.55 TaxID=1448321 RepID=A0A317VIH7_9EURO|nr:uncharacterized protein BO70DRAFT_431591 [Aspergillus heteromorphus CBS 117.55]PWY72997.1 hypothetical protein BO70DRAFT_431591 [Aspergillus heteromorphus CBS 117.55]
MLLISLGPSVFWAQRIQAVLTDGVATLMCEAYRFAKSCISTIADVFDDTLVELGQQADGHISMAFPSLSSIRSAQDAGSLLVSGARLHIRAFHFYEDDGLLRRARLIEMYDLACSLINSIASVDQATDYAMYTSESVYRTLNMPASAILRVTWSDLPDQVDLTVGEREYFSSIHVLKRRMIRNNDLNGRTAGVLTQLWRSPQTFKRKRRVFNGQTDPYLEQSSDSTTVMMPNEMDDDINSASEQRKCSVVSAKRGTHAATDLRIRRVLG